MGSQRLDLLEDLEFIIERNSLTPGWHEAQTRILHVLNAYDLMLQALYQCRAHLPTNRPPLLDEAIAKAEKS